MEAAASVIFDSLISWGNKKSACADYFVTIFETDLELLTGWWSS